MIQVVENIVSFDGSLPYAQRKSIPSQPGVYFIFDSAKLMYIGSSINLNQRWFTRQHHKHLKIKSMQRPTIAWILVDVDVIRDTEKELIKRLSPPLNGYVPGPGRNPLYNELMKRWGVYLPESYYAYIKEQAAKSGVSMNAYLITLIDKDKKDQGHNSTP